MTCAGVPAVSEWLTGQNQFSLSPSPSPPSLPSLLSFSSPPPQDEPTVVVQDARLCTLKDVEDTERRFCFSLVMPDK